jgi:hypothetical protein
VGGQAIGQGGVTADDRGWTDLMSDAIRKSPQGRANSTMCG